MKEWERKILNDPDLTEKERERLYMREWWQRAYVEEVESREQNILAQRGVRKVEFWSKSNGKGRFRRNRTLVTLMCYGGRCWEITDDLPHKGLDVVVMEIMEGHIGPHEDAWRIFYELFEQMPSG